MRNQVCALSVVVAALAVAAPADADPGAFGTCLNDSMTGKERKELAKWIFFALSAHPEMESFARVSPDARTKQDKVVAALITRLLVSDCATEFRAANAADANAVGSAFSLVGEAAMQELMRAPEVEAAIGSYGNHVDQNLIQSVLTKE